MYKLTERMINYDNSWDVIVAGAGPAGCAAAAAAAREGAKTLLIEATGALGGMGTSGLIPAWCPFSDGEKVIYKGIGERVFSAVKKGMPHIDPKALDWVAIDPELLKRVYDDLMLEYGVTVLFNTLASTVDTDGEGNVKAVIVSNKAGLTAYSAKVYVDCTGDADLAAWAGAEFQKGDPKTGELQPATHCFILSNVDDYAYKTGGKLHSEVKTSAVYKILESGKYPRIQDAHFCNSLIGPGTVGFNAGHIWKVDNTDPFSVSKALMEGRKLAEDIKGGLREFYPKAFGNAFLVETAPLMGIRETRRVVGDYCLSFEDYAERRSFDDEIGRNCYYIDVHLSLEETELMRQGKLDDKKRCDAYRAGESHGIPYRCLTPKGLKNVLVAGRSISCDRMVLGSVRVMPVCLVTGEAAGLAAALAAQTPDCDVHKVDVVRLRERLRQEGAYLP